MEKIKDNIYVETDFLGCNPSFVVTSQGLVMIDTPQKPSEALKWKKEIQKFGEVTYLINTDHHQDHAIGNYFFGGDIIVHEGTRKELLAEGKIKQFQDWMEMIEPQSKSLMDNYFIRKPKITYQNKMNIFLGDEIFELTYILSHTRYETIVYMPRKKVVFVGDTVCTNGIPILQESYLIEWLEALQFLKGMDFEVLVPGHGKIGNKDSVAQFHRELSQVIHRVIEKMDKGYSKEAVIKEVRYEDAVHRKYPPAATETFSRSIQLSIGKIYDELTQNGAKLKSLLAR